MLPHTPFKKCNGSKLLLQDSNSPIPICFNSFWTDATSCPGRRWRTSSSTFSCGRPQTDTSSRKGSRQWRQSLNWSKSSCQHTATKQLGSQVLSKESLKFMSCKNCCKTLNFIMPSHDPPWNTIPESLKKTSKFWFVATLYCCLRRKIRSSEKQPST